MELIDIIAYKIKLHLQRGVAGLLSGRQVQHTWWKTPGPVNRGIYGETFVRYQSGKSLFFLGVDNNLL